VSPQRFWCFSIQFSHDQTTCSWLWVRRYFSHENGANLFFKKVSVLAHPILVRSPDSGVGRETRMRHAKRLPNPDSRNGLPKFRYEYLYFNNFPIIEKPLHSPDPERVKNQSIMHIPALNFKKYKHSFIYLKNQRHLCLFCPHQIPKCPHYIQTFVHFFVPAVT
jgi:hypothetical protein